MLSTSQRHAIAQQLNSLKEELSNFSNLTVKELDSGLQERVRHQPTIGPITSSGIEHVNTLIDRIIWADYYLTNPDFPAKLNSSAAVKTETSPTLPNQPTPIVVKKSMSATASPAQKTAQPLQFGPFVPQPKPRIR